MHPDVYYDLTQRRLAETTHGHALHRHRLSAKRPRPPSRRRRALARGLHATAARLERRAERLVGAREA